MLKHNPMFRNVALVGSTSEIGLNICDELIQNGLQNLFLFGRKEPDYSKIAIEQKNIKFYDIDLESNDLVNLVKKNLQHLPEIDLLIVAAGFLPPENMELEPELVFKSIKINTLACATVLSIFASRMEKQSASKILLISSVASMRPRLKNFTYGASKKGADFFAEGLQHKYVGSNLAVSILRPGYVFTRMSKNFIPAPFATYPHLVSRIAVKGLFKNKKIIYAPKILQILMNILKLVPRFIFNKLE